MASMLELVVAASVLSSSLSCSPAEAWLSCARGCVAGLAAAGPGSLMLVTAFLAGTSCSQQPRSGEKVCAEPSLKH